MSTRSGWLIVVLLLLAATIQANDNPEELGQVHWQRDLTKAQQLSKQFDRPILILFQEVPGCSTCKRYGNLVLSHPLIVEAIETYFIPLVIYNNVGGKDRQTLSFYGEPSWNNPVVRIVGADKKDLLPRLSGNYAPSGLLSYMLEGLAKSGAPVPTFLPLIRDELMAEETGVDKTTLSMFCFWTGEKELGRLDGVVHTEAGFMHGREVVNVYFNPSVIGLEEVIHKGAAAQCADQAFVQSSQARTAKKLLGDPQVREEGTFRLDREPKYYLSRTPYRHVPMSPAQAVKVNALIGAGQRPDALLSPRQLKILEQVRRHRNDHWPSMIHAEDWKASMYAYWKRIDISRGA